MIIRSNIEDCKILWRRYISEVNTPTGFISSDSVAQRITYWQIFTTLFTYLTSKGVSPLQASWDIDLAMNECIEEINDK